MGQGNDLKYRIVDLHGILPQRRLRDERANPGNDVARALTVRDDASECLTDLAHIRRQRIQPAHGGIGVGDDGCDRLVDLVGNRGRQLPHRRDAVGVCQFSLYLAVPPFALSRCSVGPLAIGQVDHKGNACVPAFLEVRSPHQDWNPIAVFLKVLLFIGTSGAARFQLCHAAVVGVAPFGRRQFAPTRASQDEILAVVAEKTKEGLVGIDDAPVNIPDVDANNVGIYKAPDFRFAFEKVIVEPCILQRDSRL